MGSMDDSQQLKDALSPLLDRNLRFPTRPKIVSDLHFFDMPDGLGVQIRGLEKPVILRGELAEDIIAWLLDSLDGTRDREEIIKRRPPNCSMESAVEALLLVFRKGLIHEAEEQIIRTETKADHDEVLHRQLLFWGRQV